MQYDPIKHSLGKVFNSTPFLRKVFYRLLDLLLLRSWHIRRELKKLLQEHAVPPWERGRLPLLWCGDELVWVPGIGIDSAWKCTSNESGITPEYQPESF